LLVVRRGSQVNRIIEIIGEIWKLDSQIAAASAGLNEEELCAMKQQLGEQDDRLLDVLCKVQAESIQVLFRRGA
jgi:hypothetical protein